MEPEGKNLEACLGARARLWSDPPQFLDTIAEGIMTQQVTYKLHTHLQPVVFGSGNHYSLFFNRLGS